MGCHKAIFYILFTLLIVTRVKSEDMVHIIVSQCDNCNASSSEVVPIGAGSAASVVQLSVPSSCYFFIIQVHHHVRSMRLSYDANSNVQNSVNGTSIGLNQINNVKGNYNFYLFHNFTTLNAVLFAVTSYSEKAPMPGGCNDNNVTAPFEKITYDDKLITVDVKNASINNQPCNIQQNITFDFYRLFVKNETNPYHYQDILDMLTPDSIKKNGVKVMLPSGGSTLRRFFNNYRGYPVVFAVIASHGNESASYVPAWTYGCDMTNGTKSCYDTNFRGNWIVMSIMCYISLILLLIPRVAITVPFLNISFYGLATLFALFGVESFYLTTAILVYVISITIVLELFYKYSEHSKNRHLILRFYASSIWTIIVYNTTFEGTSTFLQGRTYFWLLYAGVCWIALWPFLNDFAHYSAVSFNLVLAVSMISGYGEVLYININAIRRIAITNFNWSNLEMPTVSTACAFFVLLFWLMVFLWKPTKRIMILMAARICGLDASAWLDDNGDDNSDDSTDESENEEAPLLP